MDGKREESDLGEAVYIVESIRSIHANFSYQTVLVDLCVHRKL